MSGFLNFFERLFDSDFMPHGHCFFWQPGILWTHVISDSLIALAYFSIPVTLFYFVRKRGGVLMKSLIAGFGAFIVACGSTHVMAVWDIWHSTYRLEGVIKAVTAILSVGTAVACARLAPSASKMATPEELAAINAHLQSEIEVRSEAERKLAVAMARQQSESEAKLQAFVEAVAEGIVLVSEDGIIVTANRRIVEMFGYAREELVGHGMDMLVPQRYRGSHVAHRERYFAEPGIRAMGAGRDLTGCRKDGTEFPAEIGLSFAKTESGTLAMGLVSDITERKRVESEMARINSELVRSNTELGQFAYVASHDLQEPLRMITGYLQLLERRYQEKLDAEATEFIRYAVEGAVRMKRLIEDLLALSRAGTQAVNFRSVEAQKLFDAACANLGVAIRESGAQVTADTLPMVFGDPVLLNQVFQNLIANAIKFRRKDQSAQIRVSAAASKEGAVFSVTDNGIGIEPRHRDRIFGIFERLHSADQFEGSGVGLAITRRILERHGGRIWVESNPDQGSTFSFLIPAQSDKLDASRAASGKS